MNNDLAWLISISILWSLSGSMFTLYLTLVISGREIGGMWWMADNDDVSFRGDR